MAMSARWLYPDDQSGCKYETLMPLGNRTNDENPSSRFDADWNPGGEGSVWADKQIVNKNFMKSLFVNNYSVL